MEHQEGEEPGQHYTLRESVVFVRGLPVVRFARRVPRVLFVDEGVSVVAVPIVRVFREGRSCQEHMTSREMEDVW